MFFWLPSKLCLKRWLSENQALEAQKGPQNSQKVVFRVGVKNEFLRNWDAKLALTNNMGSLGLLRDSAT